VILNSVAGFRAARGDDLYAMWCHRHPEHDSREARRMLDETERSLLRLPRSSPLRQGLLKALAEKRRETGLLPPQQRR
jgi:hypothetical protein